MRREGEVMRGRRGDERRRMRGEKRKCEVQKVWRGVGL